jgi:glycosyltransferase involved in cell wall biosynthesis
LAYSPELKKLLEADVAETDVVHNHSLWMLPTSYATGAAAKRGVPVVFTLHGFLEPWALSRSRWKKRLAGWAFQDRDLRLAACIHVNSVSELRNARNYGLRHPAAIVPNGVDLGPFAQMPPREELLRRYPQLKDKRICLFLSRLHRKKGLEHLVRAWHRVARKFQDWHLVIAGPDDGMESRTRSALQTLGLSSSASLIGPLYGRDKLAAYSAADVFLLPSFSEGFSMAVLEAMAAGLPVLVTPGCNFPEAVTAGAAVCVEPTVEGTEAGLRALLGMSEAERREMGRRARRLIQCSYTWDEVARKMLKLYGWLLGGGPRPEFVEG